MMRTDAIIQREGMQALHERFVTLLLREPFDYTEWQREHWKNETLTTFMEKAKSYWDAAHQSKEGEMSELETPIGKRR